MTSLTKLALISFTLPYLSTLYLADSICKTTRYTVDLRKRDACEPTYCVGSADAIRVEVLVGFVGYCCWIYADCECWGWGEGKK